MKDVEVSTMIKEMNRDVTAGIMTTGKRRTYQTRNTNFSHGDTLELCPYTLEPVQQCGIRDLSEINRTCPFTFETSFQMHRIRFRNRVGNHEEQ